MANKGAGKEETDETYDGWQGKTSVSFVAIMGLMNTHTPTHRRPYFSAFHEPSLAPY